MKQRKDTALRWLRFSLGALLIVPVLLFAYVAVTTFRAAFQLADDRIDHALSISAEQALRIFRTIDVTLDSIRADPHSVAAELFQRHLRPQLALTRGEQELLELALDGVGQGQAGIGKTDSQASLRGQNYS